MPFRENLTSDTDLRPCKYCKKLVVHSNVGAVATHQASLGCRVKRRRLELVSHRRMASSFEGPEIHVEIGEPTIKEPWQSIEGAIGRRQDIVSRLRELQTRESVQRWLALGAVNGLRPQNADQELEQGSQGESENESEYSSENDPEEEREEMLARNAEFLDKVRTMFSEIVDGSEGTGVCRKAQERILKLLYFSIDELGRDRKLRGSDVFGDSAVDTYNRMMKKCVKQDSWEEQTFVTSKKDFKCTAVWDTAILDRLKEVVTRNFHRMRRLSDRSGVYGHPVTGKFMAAQEDLVRRQRLEIGDFNEARDFVVLLSLYSDSTQLANKGSINIHPLIMGVANLEFEDYARELQYVCFLNLTLVDLERVSENRARDAKRELFSMQFERVTRILKEASYLGCNFSIEINGISESFRFFPALFDMPLDHPEMAKLLCINSNRCGQCLWPTQSERDSETAEISGESSILERSECEARSISGTRNRTGYHSTFCGLWGFNGSCPPEFVHEVLKESPLLPIFRKVGTNDYQTDLYKTASLEKLHQLDSGLTTYMRELVYLYLSKKLGWRDSKIEEINYALRDCLLRESRWRGARFPSLKKEAGATLAGYIGGMSKLEAMEHRMVWQLMVPVLSRFLGESDDLVKLAAAYMRYYTCRERRFVSSRVHTDMTLEETERIFSEFRAMLLGYWRPSGSDSAQSGNESYSNWTIPFVLGWHHRRPKLHWGSHFAESVRREGFSEIVSGNVHESSHRVLKRLWKQGRTNNQGASAVSQISSLLRRSQYVAKIIQREERIEENGNRRSYQTVAKEARVLDFLCMTQPTLKRTDMRVDLKTLREWVEFEIRKRPKEVPPHSLPIQDLKAKIGSWQLGAVLLDELASLSKVVHIDEFLESCPDCFLLIAYQAAVPSILPGEDRSSSRSRCLQKLTCDHEYTSRKNGSSGPWLDCVALSSPESDHGDSEWYARIMCMFYLNASRILRNASDGNSSKWIPLMLFRYFEREEELLHEQHRLETNIWSPKLTKLRYSARPRSEIREKSLMRTRWWFSIASAESVVRKIHVVAANEIAAQSLRTGFVSDDLESCSSNFDRESQARFYINHYMWNTGSFQPYTIAETQQLVPHAGYDGRSTDAID